MELAQLDSRILLSPSCAICGTLYICQINLSVTNSVFPSLSALWTNCPGNAHSWPCLHQVRQVSFYFVFHQLLLLNKAFGSLEYAPLFKCSFSPGQSQPASAISYKTPCNLLFQHCIPLLSFLNTGYSQFCRSITVGSSQGFTLQA